MSTFTTTTKSATATLTPTTKSGEIIYFVAENLYMYLVGATESDYLVTQDAVTWNNLTKS
jgi:hypothetical protein